MVFYQHSIYSLFIITLTSNVLIAQMGQAGAYWIFLREPKSAFLDNQSEQTPQAPGISERALKRRAKSLPPKRLIDQLDFPVSETAVSDIKRTGVRIRTTSRWFNAVSVEATLQQLHALRAMGAVSGIEPVARLKRTEPLLPSVVPSLSFDKTAGSGELDYGPSGTQLRNIRVTDLHSIGVNGRGVLIAILDNGFNNHRTHTALKNIDIVAEYDFIHSITDVNRQPWENLIQGDHGAGVLSAIGGFANGQLIGAAHGASFLLAKTEMDSSGGNIDFHSEEDTYVAALEWAERLGADITSSSLGYKDFTAAPFYTTADLDGNTTIVAQAALIAARKGVLVVTAMGNDGDMPMGLHRDSTLVSPADADSIIGVGATSSDGELAVFSGCGPTADGRVKPDVVAQGMGVYWADGATTTAYLYAQGTSCSTPLVAGVAALVLSAHPELTNMQVRQALLETAKHINDGTTQTTIYPNNYYGYGFVDAYAAAMYFGLVTPIQTKIFQNYPNPFNNSTTIKFEVSFASDVELAVFNLLGQRVKTIFRGWVLNMGITQWNGTDDYGRRLATGLYIARLKTSYTVQSKKMLYLK